VHISNEIPTVDLVRNEVDFTGANFVSHQRSTADLTDQSNPCQVLGFEAWIAAPRSDLHDVYRPTENTAVCHCIAQYLSTPFQHRAIDLNEIDSFAFIKIDWAALVLSHAKFHRSLALTSHGSFFAFAGLLPLGSFLILSTFGPLSHG
jgi:hypothetical protein